MADFLSGLKNAAWLATRKNQIANTALNAPGANIGKVGSLAGNLGFLGEATQLPGAVMKAGNAAIGLYETGEGLLLGGFNKQNIRATMDRANAPGYQSFTSTNGIQTGKYGSTDWNPSANPTTQRGNQQVADRAYQSHVANVAQQTAQNPLFQKYQVADLTKQYNTAANPAEKQRIGLEIWAQTHGDLAAKLKSGQVGYAESRTAPGMSNAGGAPIGGLPMPVTPFNAAAAMAPNTSLEQTFGMPVPGYGMVSATPMAYNPGAPQGPVTDGMIQASYGQQLFSSPDFAKVAKDKAFLQQAYQQQGLK